MRESVGCVKGGSVECVKGGSVCAKGEGVLDVHHFSPTTHLLDLT